MKNLVCVFAHPDDEAFGPAGTIAKFAKTHNVYILCATKGEAGLQNQKSTHSASSGQEIKNQKYNSKIKNLGKIRAEELRRSAKILGVKKVYFLGFKDGTLSNNFYHKLAAKIKVHLLKLKPSIVLTFEPRGVSGHIDHITVAMVTMFAVQKFRFIKTVLQFCRLDSFSRRRRDYFIYFPKGYKRSQVDKIVNIKDVWEKKVAAMNRHQSQLKDIKRIMKIQSKLPREEYFLVVKP